MNFPEAIRELREKQLRWTQKQLAHELRKAPNTVLRWEMGDRSPSPEVCEKLAGLAQSAELREFFWQRSGAAGEPPEPAPTLPPAIARHHSTGQRALDVLAAAAAQGSDYAANELANLAEKLLQRAGHADRAAPQPGGALRRASPSAVGVETAAERKWAGMLYQVLRSGNRTAIDAVTKNLEAFSDYVTIHAAAQRQSSARQLKRARRKPGGG